MLDFEGGLARAEARAGVIPPEAAEAIAASCTVENFDIPSLYRDAASAGTLAIPLVRQLTKQVEGDGSKYVHWGATSQDVIDTALVLQMRDGIGLLLECLLKVCAASASLAERYRGTPMAGRTLLQQALPITFGLKAARWLSATTRQVQRLQFLGLNAMVLQFGGAAGTLASLGTEGIRVSELLAEELDLAVPELPWHTERDRIVDIASALVTTAGVMQKIASDVVFLTQTEVAEVAEGEEPGKGGSSAMPHKRNPVDCTMAIAAARLAIGSLPVILNGMAQEHERAVGGWQAEWEALPNLFRYTSHAVERVLNVLESLNVDPERMLFNLDHTHGLIMAEALSMALAAKMGRAEAYDVVKAACQRAVESNQNLHQIVLGVDRIRDVLSVEDIELVFDPTGYLGSTDTFIDRALQSYREIEMSKGVS